MAHSFASVSPLKPDKMGGVGGRGLWGKCLSPELDCIAGPSPRLPGLPLTRRLMNPCSPLSPAVPATGPPAPSPPPISSPPAKAVIFQVLPQAGVHCPVSWGLHGLWIFGHPIISAPTPAQDWHVAGAQGAFAGPGWMIHSSLKLCLCSCDI